jgi:hypothetical protein
MRNQEPSRVSRWSLTGLLLLLCSCAPRLEAQAAAAYQPTIPKVWDDAEMRDLEVPLARAEYSPKHVSASFYYAIPVWSAENIYGTHAARFSSQYSW